MVYLIHFAEPFRHARHYMGWCPEGEAERRLREHRCGYGARLTRHVAAAGIGMKLAKVWPGASRDTERQFKTYHNGPRYCPICKDERRKAREKARKQ